MQSKMQILQQKEQELINKNDLLSIFDIRDGGLAIYGGLIGAILCGGIMCKIRKVNLL